MDRNPLKKKSVRDTSLRGYGIEFRPVKPFDLPSLRRWRNNPEISKYMNSSNYISPKQQRIWYENIRKNVVSKIEMFEGALHGFNVNIGEITNAEICLDKASRFLND